MIVFDSVICYSKLRYGGGVLEILPSETGNIRVPKLSMIDFETKKKLFEIIKQIQQYFTNHDNKGIILLKQFRDNEDKYNILSFLHL